MGKLKRFSMIAFVVSAVASIGVLAALWLAWEPLLPVVAWLASRSWFFTVETALLGITAFGLLVVLLRALTAPGRSSQLKLKRDHGSIVITKNAIQSTVKHVIDGHSDLNVHQVKVSITRRRNQRMSVHAKIDPGRNAELAELGAKLQDEISATLEAFAGRPVEAVRITFVGSADAGTSALAQKATQRPDEASRRNLTQPLPADSAK